MKGDSSNWGISNKLSSRHDGFSRATEPRLITLSHPGVRSVPKTKHVQVIDDESRDLETRIIKAVTAVGPRNVALIARMTGAHQETIRYKIKRQFVNKGFRFQAEVDYGKLGLALHLVKFKLNQLYNESAPKFFKALSSHSYLIHFSKDLPSGDFTTFFAIPEGKGEEFRVFLEGLRQKKLIEDFSIFEILAERHKPFDPTFFNFQSGAWEVDWHKVGSMKSSPLTAAKRGRAEDIDMFDLMIIKELQSDALQHVVGMSRSLKTNPKTMEYHYRTHVVGKKLLPGYRIRWMKDSDNSRSHSMVFARYTFHGLTPEEFRAVQEKVSRVPFLWVENILPDGTYLATFCIPNPDFVEMNSYLNRELGTLGRKVEVGFIKAVEASNFVVPYGKFVNGEWQFDPDKMSRAVVQELNKSLEK